MHYHLYKDPKKNYKRSLASLPVIGGLATKFGITDLSLDKLDRITAILLVAMFTSYSAWDLSFNRDRGNYYEEAEVAVSAPEYKYSNTEVAAEKALKMEFSSNYDDAKTKKQEAENAENKEIFTKISSIKNNISKILEEKARLMPKSRKVTVSKGDTLVSLLVNKANVSRDEAFKAVDALKKLYNPSNIIPGNEITVFFHKNPELALDEFKGIKIDKDVINSVTVNRSDKGTYKAKETTKDVRKVSRGFKGDINSSLYMDAKLAGVPDNIIADMIKIYSWNVDFQRDIQNGDKFEVLFEEYRTEDNKVVPGKGKVIYAKLALQGDAMPLYLFEDRDGFVDYFDDKGQSAKKVLMKTPINGARLSSGFGMRRHPIMGYSKMHQGLDFAAPSGTPIYASGNGIIEKIGRFSSYGNYIKINHRNNLKTAYGHMKGFKSGLKPGSKVKQGDVIGYVGSTGRSTGPHLHYEVILKGVQKNPASVDLPTGTLLRGKDLAKFKKQRDNMQASFKDATKNREVASSDGLDFIQ